MAEFGLSVRLHTGLRPVPNTSAVPYLFAPGTNRDQAPGQPGFIRARDAAPGISFARSRARTGQARSLMRKEELCSVQPSRTQRRGRGIPALNKFFRHFTFEVSNPCVEDLTSSLNSSLFVTLENL
jgi:hypothetical protein